MENLLISAFSSYTVEFLRLIAAGSVTHVAETTWPSLLEKVTCNFLRFEKNFFESKISKVQQLP